MAGGVIVTAAVNLAGSANQYYSGSTVGFIADFVSGSNPIDAADAAFVLQDPSGIVTTYSGLQITHVQTGRYTLALDCLPVGLWIVTATCATPGAAVAQTQFIIVPQVQTPATTPPPPDAFSAFEVSVGQSFSTLGGEVGTLTAAEAADATAISNLGSSTTGSLGTLTAAEAADAIAISNLGSSTTGSLGTLTAAEAADAIAISNLGSSTTGSLAALHTAEAADATAISNLGSSTTGSLGTLTAAEAADATAISNLGSSTTGSLAALHTAEAADATAISNLGSSTTGSLGTLTAAEAADATAISNLGSSTTGSLGTLTAAEAADAIAISNLGSSTTGSLAALHTAEAADATAISNLGSSTTGSLAAKLTTALLASTAFSAAPTIGGLTMDNPALAYLNMTPALMGQQLGACLPAASIANNPFMTPSTAGVFWTAPEAAAWTGGVGVVNHVTLITAAINWAGANKREVVFPAGVYSIGATSFVINSNDVHLTFQYGAVVESTATNKAAASFQLNGARCTIKGGTFRCRNDTWLDWFTGVILPTPNLSDWRTVCGGVWAGITNYGGWLTSATQAALVNTNVAYFDALPPAMTLSQVNVGGFFIHNNQYVAYGSTLVANSVSLVTIGAWTGYQATFLPPAGTPFAIIGTSPGAQPSVARQASSASAPFIAERPAIAAPTFYLLSAQPVMYAGGFFSVVGPNCSLLDIEMQNNTGGRSVITRGDAFIMLHSRGYASDGNTGSAYIRILGGYKPFVGFCVFHSGDQALQFVPGTAWNGVGFGASSNTNIIGGRYVGCIGVSLSAQAAAWGLTVQNKNQAIPWTLNQTIPVGNTLTLPAPLPAGLTLLQLQQSAQGWGSAVYYPTTGFNVANSGGIYTLTQTGTSSSTSNGPSGTGSSIADGTCVWAYVGPGATQNISCSGRVIPPGTCVTGVSFDGTNYTITVVPPAGYSSGIGVSLAPGRVIQFLTGVPLESMTCSVLDCAVVSSFLMSLRGVCITMQNADSSGIASATIDDCTLDASWANVAGAQPNVGVVDILAGPSLGGGVSITIKGCRMIRPLFAQITATGNVKHITLDTVSFDPPAAPGPRTGIFITGASGGVLKNSEVWGSPGHTSISLGGIDGQDQLNQVLPGAVNNFTIDGNHFRGATDGNTFITLKQGGGRRVTGNYLYPATQGGLDTAAFLSLGASAGVSSPDQFDGNDTTAANGTPYTIAAGCVGYVGLLEKFNPVANLVPATGSAPGFPPQFIAAVMAAITGAPVS